MSLCFLALSLCFLALSICFLVLSLCFLALSLCFLFFVLGAGAPLSLCFLVLCPRRLVRLRRAFLCFLVLRPRRAPLWAYCNCTAGCGLASQLISCSRSAFFKVTLLSGFAVSALLGLVLLLSFLLVLSGELLSGLTVTALVVLALVARIVLCVLIASLRDPLPPATSPLQLGTPFRSQ